MRPGSFPTGVASIKDAPCLCRTLAFPTKLAAAGKTLVSTLSKHQQPSHPSRGLQEEHSNGVFMQANKSAGSWQMEGVRDVGQARPPQDLRKHLFTTSSLFRRPEPHTPICSQSTRLCQGLSSWVWSCFGQGTFGELLDFWSLAELPCLAPATQVFSGQVPRGPLCPVATCCWSAAIPQLQAAKPEAPLHTVRLFPPSLSFQLKPNVHDPHGRGRFWPWEPARMSTGSQHGHTPPAGGRSALGHPHPSEAGGEAELGGGSLVTAESWPSRSRGSRGCCLLIRTCL